MPKRGKSALGERNPLAHPTLDMYLPLSKFESIHRVSIKTLYEAAHTYGTVLYKLVTTGSLPAPRNICYRYDKF